MSMYHLISIKNSPDGLLYRRLGHVSGGLAQAKAHLKKLTHNVVGNSESYAVLNEHGRIAWRL